ncbi:hypothetical protein J1N35_019423 [Gossypium stocksii]|uniref:Uncharacterized protein n=1 Tax=Gossypium stocksii TaxID=47602 RepID=A0A9D3VQX2_9ROSI|nr:hypothetical protein J1N35_019423 [Gossypium stocksii]
MANRNRLDEDKDFDLMDGDIQKSIVNVSQDLINGKIQRIEYQFLPMVYFHCGHYGYLKEVCQKMSIVSSMAKETIPSEYVKMVVVFVMGEEH